MIKHIIYIISLVISSQSIAQVPIKIKFTKNGIESKIKTDSTAFNFYVEANKDTVWFNYDSNVIQCDYMMSIEKAHNHCTFYSFDKPMNGFYTLRTIDDQLINEFKGTLENGLYQDGTFILYFNNGAIQLTGQYKNNWKYGYWTGYDKLGTLLYLIKFIEGVDDPVVEYSFEENGQMIKTTDEEDVMNELIKK